MKYDYLIVGAGLFGSAFAYRAWQHGKRCLVIDKRAHTGGNVYCQKIENINVHKYGAHIFHTSDRQVWEFVNSLAEFNRYTNCPLANYKGQLYNLPFNMNTFYRMWGSRTPEEAMREIERQRDEARKAMAASGRKEPGNLEEQALALVGRDIYERLIKGYTEKQWGRKCRDLPAFIIRRIPVRMSFDNNYFNDKYQGIPTGGYNVLIDRMLEGAEVRTSADFFSDRQYWESIADKIVYTGKIDEFFGYRFGRLEYRSLRFEEEMHGCCNLQGNAVVNYTGTDVPYTRIIEHKHFECFGDEVYRIPVTITSTEYPAEWKEGMEPYYPINDGRNTGIYEKYRELAGSTENVIFGGRLAEYRYYDMHNIIRKVLDLDFQL